MKKISILFISLLLLCSCKTTSTLNKYNEQMFDVGFDTVVQLLAYCEDEETYQTYQTLTRDAFIYYNQLFDRYQTYEGVNNVKTINEQAGIAPVKVDQEIIDVVKQAKTYSLLSDNQYDITFGNVLEIWHDKRELSKQDIYEIPTLQELEEAKKHTGWDKVMIDETAQTIYLNDSQASLDLGSIAKGYATEMVAKKLQSAGLSHAILNAGGNVRIIGNKPDADHWNVGLQIPLATDSSALADVYIEEATSFVTSGDYQRYYEVDKEKYHHIIDPHTLFPAKYMRSVTAITKDSSIADILSTTLFTQSFEDGNALLEKLRAEGMEVDAIWVFDDTTPLPKNVEFQTSGAYKVVISDGIQEQVHMK